MPTTEDFVPSPAPYSKELFPAFHEAYDLVATSKPGGWLHLDVYDPMAGNGIRLFEMADEWARTRAFHPDGTPRLATFSLNGSEIEREFIAKTWVTERSMLNHRLTYSTVQVSPAYGNRASDQYLGTPAEREERARTGKKPRRMSYAISLGRKLSPGSGAALQVGPKYRAFHQECWQHVFDHNLNPGGHFILNVKSHYRGWAFQDVAGWHLDACLRIGFELVKTWEIECPGMRDGQNREARDLNEYVYLFRKPEGAPS